MNDNSYDNEKKGKAVISKEPIFILQEITSVLLDYFESVDSTVS